MPPQYLLVVAVPDSLMEASNRRQFSNQAGRICQTAIYETDALRRQQRYFPSQSRSGAFAVESADGAVRGNHAMTRHIRREGIAAKRLTDGTRGVAAHRLGQGAVGNHSSARHSPESGIDAQLEVGRFTARASAGHAWSRIAPAEKLRGRCLPTFWAAARAAATKSPACCTASANG